MNNVCYRSMLNLCPMLFMLNVLCAMLFNVYVKFDYQRLQDGRVDNVFISLLYKITKQSTNKIITNNICHHYKIKT